MRGNAGPPGAGRRWVVCADDFALDAGAVEATLALIELGRVTATSVLVDSPHWKAAAPELKAVSDRVDVGLHLNLTEKLETGSSTWRLPSLLIQSTLRLLPRWQVSDLVERQLDAFADVFGRLPDFVDGHHHVHQLPVVREVLIESVRAREPKSPPWLRICSPPEGAGDYKDRIIGILGAAGGGAAKRISDQPLPGGGLRLRPATRRVSGKGPTVARGRPRRCRFHVPSLHKSVRHGSDRNGPARGTRGAGRRIVCERTGPRRRNGGARYRDLQAPDRLSCASGVRSQAPNRPGRSHASSPRSE